MKTKEIPLYSILQGGANGVSVSMQYTYSDAVRACRAFSVSHPNVPFCVMVSGRPIFTMTTPRAA